MTPAMTARRHLLPTVALQESYQLCRERVRQRLGAFRWMTGNLAADVRSRLDAVLALAVRSDRLCDIHLARQARLELLEELREDFRNNFMEEESTDQFPALLDTMRQHAIPQQYLHDIVAAADMCARIPRFQDFDQWLQLGCRLGGGTLLSAIPVTGAAKPDYEASAIKLGQAVYLTYLLNDIVDEIQKLEFFMPAADIETFGVDLSKHNPDRPAPSMLRLVRQQVERIESLYHDGGQVVRYLSLDGQRVIKSLVSVSWYLLMKLKQQPERALQASLELSSGEMLGFRLKHVMGLEGGVAVLPRGDEHHGH
jgi:phytoene/squalene synthetase